MGELSKGSFGERAKDWLIRYIKFNVVGFLVFLMGTAIYALSFHTFGAWAWLIASGSGGILQFVLINYVNKTKWGRIFNDREKSP
jgi:inner membrane protein involved in colicin E2 resistance